MSLVKNYEHIETLIWKEVRLTFSLKTELGNTNYSISRIFFYIFHFLKIWFPFPWEIFLKREKREMIDLFDFTSFFTIIHTSMVILAQITFKNITSMLRILRSVRHRFSSYSKLLLWIISSTFFSTQCLSKCVSIGKRQNI